MSSGCGRASAGCRSGRSTTSGRRRRSAARWPATSATSRCSCRCWPGPDPRAPQALGEPGSAFADPTPADLGGIRVALSTDLGGAFEVDTEVAGIVASSASLFGSVADAHPALPEADDTFRTLRAWHFQAMFGELLAAHPDAFKQSLADNIRAGEHLTGADVARAYRQRTTLVRPDARVLRATYDVLVLPAAQVPPFPADQQYPATSTAASRRRTSTGCGPATSSP